MRVTLIHNPSAGNGNSSADELVELLEDAGYKPRHQSTKDDDWKSALKEPADLIVVAGGDGTVTRVASNLDGNDAVLAIIPLGTANNIATALGIQGAPRTAVAAFAKAAPRQYDLWLAAGPWGDEILVEGCGLGAVTETAAALHAAGDQHLDPLEKLMLARTVMKNLAARLEPFDVRAKCDGETIEGSFLVFEVMNVGFAGPQLLLCANANPGDDRLDIAVVRAEERGDFVKWLAGGAARSWRVKPFRRCRNLEIAWTGAHMRVVDGRTWPAENDRKETDAKEKNRLRARFAPTRAIRMLVPK